jgi:hypothetical protein
MSDILKWLLEQASKWPRGWPPLLAAALLVIGFEVVREFNRDPSLSEVLTPSSFKAWSVVVLGGLVSYYLYGLIRPHLPLQRALFLLVAGVGVSGGAYFVQYERPDILTVDVFFLGDPNFRIDTLGYLQVLSKQKHFLIRIHDRPIVDDLGASNSVNDLALEKAKSLHETQRGHGKWTATLLILARPLDYNYFSVAKENYAILTTAGWQEKSDPARPSVYDYLILQIPSLGLLTASHRNRERSIQYHDNWVTIGCVFDHHGLKSLLNSHLYRPTICEEHKTQVNNTFGNRVLGEYLHIVGKSWLTNPNVKARLRDVYGYEPRL